MVTDDELRAILQAQYDAALGESSSSQISQRRENALKAYRGELYGNEREGRSKVISWDVFDVTESALPSLLKIFASTDEIVEFEPENKEDEEVALQASDYINYVFMKDNEGFTILSTWFKDALLQINGYVKVFWEESEKWVHKEYTGQTAEQLALLLDGEEDYKVSGQESRIIKTDDGMEIEVYDVELRCKKKIKKARVVNCAPEDVGKAPGTLNIGDASYSYHRFEKFASDLIEMGYNKDLIKQAVSSSDTYRSGEEATTRNLFEDEQTGTSPDIDQTMRPVIVTEHYIRMDFDGDGVAELRKITTGGEGQFVVFDNSEIAENPLVEISPIPLPHQSYGMALSEPVMPIQEVKTVIQRQLLDNFYNVNNQRPVVNMEQAGESTLSDLLNAAPGHPIRTQGDRAVNWMNTPSLGGESFNLLEYQDTLIEQRSGMTRYNQGLDADSLNKTATGIQIIQNASQERLMLIARFFGEGVRQMFAKLLRLTIQHQDIERTFRLRNKWVTVDPRTWNMEMDVTISVGLGTGNKDQMLAHLMSVYNMQKEMVMGGLMEPQYLLHTAAKMVENMGFKNTEAFFPDEEALEEKKQQEAQQPPQPDPETQKLAFEQEKAAADMNMKQAEMQFKQQDAAESKQIDMQKMQMDAELTMQIEREKIASQERMKAMELEARSNDNARMAESASKPATMLQVDTNGAMEQAAQAMQQSVSDQSQAFAAMMEQMASTQMFLMQALERMNAPKHVSVVRDASGRIATAEIQPTVN